MENMKELMDKAIVELSVAQGTLATASAAVGRACRDETTCRNRVNNAQKDVDAVIGLLKQSAPHWSDWGGQMTVMDNDDPALPEECDEARLLPCPFCGAGQTQFRENGKVWSGTRYSTPASVSVFHHCEKPAGQPHRAIERVGRDLESAIAAWNARA